MIRRPAGRCRIDAIEPEVAKFQRIDEHIDRAYRIALVDPIIKAFRQQRRLLAIRPLNKTLHQPPAIQQGNHSIDGVLTPSGSFSDLGARSCEFWFPSMSRHSRRSRRVSLAQLRTNDGFAIALEDPGKIGGGGPPNCPRIAFDWWHGITL